MMKMVDKACFIDTNVLIYATIAEAPLHHASKNALESLEFQGYSLWISRQVIREFLAVLSRPQSFSTLIQAAQLIQSIKVFEQRFSVAEEGPEVTGLLLDLLQNYSVGGKQIHDANIVATMLANQLTCLFTYNGQDFQRFSDKICLLDTSTIA